MHNSLMSRKNRKAQVGTTLTWVMGTLIIVIVLIAAIFVSSLIFKKKDAGDVTFGTADTLAAKSLFSYLMTKDSNGSNVYTEIKTDEKLNDFNGNLGLSIFKTFYFDYEKMYSAVWFGIFEPAAGNKYFGTKPSVKANVAPDQAYTSNNVDLRVTLNDKKDIELLLIGKGVQGS